MSGHAPHPFPCHVVAVIELKTHRCLLRTISLVAMRGSGVDVAECVIACEVLSAMLLKSRSQVEYTEEGRRALEHSRALEMTVALRWAQYLESRDESRRRNSHTVFRRLAIEAALGEEWQVVGKGDTNRHY